jgi:hypothetical protein
VLQREERAERNDGDFMADFKIRDLSYGFPSELELNLTTPPHIALGSANLLKSSLPDFMSEFLDVRRVTPSANDAAFSCRLDTEPAPQGSCARFFWPIAWLFPVFRKS